MRIASLTLAAVVAACAAVAPRASPTNGPAPPPPLPEAAALAASPFPCPTKPRAIGQLYEPALDEISGIVESARQPGVFFVHNDSGDSPRFFAIDLSGRLLAIFPLTSVPRVMDAEDIAAGPGPDGRRYLYLGDTGNNFASMGLGIPRRKTVLYRIAEPEVPASPRALEHPIADAARLVFTFPDGARDVEAFFVDPRSGDLLLISKQSDGHSQVLTATAADLAAGGGELRLAARLQFGKPPLVGNPMPTAASISADGSRILVRTYSSVFAYEREPHEAVASALVRSPRRLDAPPERQGEAISFADEGRAFVTISEGKHAQIFCGSWPKSEE